MGLGYHWSLDFAGSLVVIPRRAKYVLVMIEHFEFIAISQNSAKLAVAIILGAPTHTLTDQREFLDVSKELYTKALIDHHTTSRDHPEVDGLVERVVQTTKRCLRKYGLLRGSHRNWDLMLLWIAMGYRFTRHSFVASYISYQLLYGREPTL